MLILDPGLGHRAILILMKSLKSRKFVRLAAQRAPTGHLSATEDVHYPSRFNDESWWLLHVGVSAVELSVYCSVVGFPCPANVSLPIDEVE